MKILLIKFRLLLAFLLLGGTLGATAATIFTDNFSNGSTLDGESVPGGSTNASFTSYDLASSKNATATTIAPGLLSAKLTGATSSGYWEVQALFATNPVVLVKPGDYVKLTMVFTNSAGTLWNGGSSPVWVGLYNSGAPSGTINPPVSGGALDNGGLSGTAYPSGNCQLWSGYIGQIYSGSTSHLLTRPVQDPTVISSDNQELLGNSASGGTFRNPRGNDLADAATPTIALDTSTAYTLQMQITLSTNNELIIQNLLYSGAGTGGTLLMTNQATDNAPQSKAFDGLAFGAFNHNGSPSADPQMDVSSITVTGHSTPITTPPSITTDPVSVTAPIGAFVPFTVAADGFNMTYQWYRNGTNLVDGGDISGAQSSTLIVSPISAADAASGANGYWCQITGAGGYTTNSTKASLTLGTAKNLVWSGNSSTWDLGVTAAWDDPNNNLTTFNYGDTVTFNDQGNGGNVYFTGQYLAAGSLTVSGGTYYNFTGSGSFAGPGTLRYIGSGELDINNANTYTGGTIISNASAYLYLGQLNGLGDGPITFAKAGGTMEVVPAGSGSSGIRGNVNVDDDFTVQFDGDGTYAGVFYGNLSGPAGKTLTLEPNALVNPASTNRYRIYDSSLVYNGNLALDPSDPAVANAYFTGTVLAPYNSSGSQTYNGVISGSGGIVQRGAMTILNGLNTYTGGTTPTTGTIALGTNSVGNNPVTAGPIGTGPLYLYPEGHSTASAEILAYGGARSIANPIEYPSGDNNLTLVIGGTNDLTLAGPYTLNGIDSLTTYTNRIIEVDNTALTTISGQISDGGMGFGLEKTGSGTLALDNTETYSGTTTVAGGLLGGTGTIAGPVVATNGGIAPGDKGIGTLKINNSLTLQSGSTSMFEVNQASSASDQLNVSGAVNYGGTLSATNLSGSLSIGDHFTLFHAGSHTGNFAAVTGTPGPGLAWSFDPTNGVLSVVQGVNLNPTNIVFSVSGNKVNLSWPTDHIGWALQVQTNSLANGLQLNSNAWVTVPGSTMVNSTNFPIDPANASVYYRLVYMKQ